MSSHEPSPEEWREIARQAIQEKDPGKLIHLAQKTVEKYDEEQHSKKPNSSFTGDVK